MVGDQPLVQKTKGSTLCAPFLMVVSCIILNKEQL